MSEPIIIEVKVDLLQEDSIGPEYRVGLWLPGEDMPLVEENTYYPEMCAASLLRAVDLKPVKTRTEYVCPDCGRADCLWVRQQEDKVCAVEVTDDTFDYPGAQEEVRRWMTSVECSNCAWVSPLLEGTATGRGEETFVRSVLRAVEVECE